MIDDFNPRFKPRGEIDPNMKYVVNKGTIIYPKRNEVLISFNDDIDADLFNEWLTSKGMNLFKEFRDKQEVQI